MKNSGSILLESVPIGVNIDDVQHDLEMVHWPEIYPSVGDSAKTITVDSWRSFRTRAARMVLEPEQSHRFRTRRYNRLVPGELCDAGTTYWRMPSRLRHTLGHPAA